MQIIYLKNQIYKGGILSSNFYISDMSKEKIFWNFEE